MEKKLLIFDLDGTIADTIWSIRDAVNLALELHGYEKRSYDEVRRAIGNGAYELIRKSLPTNVAEDRAEVLRVLSDYDRLYGTTYSRIDGCYDGMMDTLVSLKNKGYILVVLSNKQDAYVKKIVELLFSKGFISFAEGQRDDRPKKPDPTVPLMIARHFGVAPENCAFIGDSEVDVMTGKNSSMTAIGCSWGYRPREALEDADVIVDHPCEIDKIFE